MSVIYFKAKPIDVLILISLNYVKKSQKIVLKEIKFFNDEVELQTYIKKKELTVLVVENDLISISNLKMLILDYLSGKKINLFKKIRELNIELALKEKFPTDFSKKVIKYMTEDLEIAQYTTYSEIGEKIGSKAYRAIGNVLKRNPLPLIIPCHRVIRKNGDIGGFMGNLDDSWQQKLKKKLLNLEKS